MSDEPTLPPEDLARLEDALSRALCTGDAGELPVLGYGEISCVVRWSGGGRTFACKRLPVFDGEARLDAYAACFDAYLAALADRGVRVVPSRLAAIPRGDARVVWCLQPELPKGSLLPDVMRACDVDEARRRFLDVVDAIERVTEGVTVGIDAQLSNWALVDGDLVYLDITTPMLRDASGAEKLDADLFLASLPWALRWPVKRLLLGEILDKYYRPRGAVIDLLGNLVKERLEHLLPPFLEAVAGRYSPRISEDEVRRYYQSDARTWELLQRLRRADRLWQTRVRRRPYPFLLPGRIER